MQKYLLLLMASLILYSCENKKNEYILNEISVIPQPAKVEKLDGVFTLSKNATIAISAEDAEMQLNAEFLQTLISTSTGYELKIINGKTDSGINLNIDKTEDNISGYYELNVNHKTVDILYMV